MSEYTDGFLKFDNKAQAEDVFAELGVFPTEFGNLTQTVFLEDKTLAVDVLFGNGVVHSPTGNIIESPEGPVPETVPVEGYHVNVRYFDGALPEGLVPYAINPDPVNPKCRFA